MKTRKITVPPRVPAAPGADKPPRERRKLHVRYGGAANDGDDGGASEDAQ